MHALKTWLPALAGMTCLGLGAGLIGIYGFFVEPLSREFGVGAAIINLGPVALLLVPGIVAPFVGKLADRLPIHLLMLTGVTIAMLSLLGISQANSLLLAAVGFVCFVLGLTMYGPVVVNGLMVKIYAGSEARALAIAAMGISFATATLPPLLAFLLGSMDWRAALATLAVALFVVLFVVVLALVPRTTATERKKVSTSAGKGIYQQAPFWLIGLCVALGLNVAIVLAVCYPPHFINQGYSVAEAGWFLSLSGIAGLLGKSCVAWLGDSARRYAKWFAIVILLLQVTGLTLLFSAQSTAVTMFAMFVFGIGGGAFLPMQPYLNSQYFDVEIIAQVNGAQMPLLLPFGLIGAPLAGYVFDQTGSYLPVLLALAGTLLIAAVFAMKLPAPRK